MYPIGLEIKNDDQHVQIEMARFASGKKCQYRFHNNARARRNPAVSAITRFRHSGCSKRSFRNSSISARLPGAGPARDDDAIAADATAAACSAEYMKPCCPLHGSLRRESNPASRYTAFSCG
jgi:hypothetical protein